VPISASSFGPGRYDQIPVIELARAAARGWTGVDQRLLKSILNRGEPAVQDLLAFSREPQDNYPVDLKLVVADLFRALHSPEAVHFYLDLIRQEPLEVDDSIIEALLAFHEAALEPLLQLYEELGEEQGADVAFILSGLGIRDERILHLLLERLEFDAADGAFLLGIYGDPAARPALENMRAEIPEEDTELRREIDHALELIDTPVASYEHKPFDILTEYREHEAPEFDILPESVRIEMFSSEESEIRAGAAHSFFNAELQAGARDALLKLARHDADANVRGRAWESLADATGESESIRSELLQALKDRSRPIEERGGAAVGLYGVADSPEIRPQVEALYEEGGAARAKALETMWRSIYAPFAKYFAPHLQDPDREIVRQALRGAGYFRLSSYSDQIVAYFKDDDLREDALFAYAIAMPGETTRGGAKGMLRKIDSITPLSRAETRLVMFAIDERLRLYGLDPVFERADSQEDDESEPQTEVPPAKVGRNDPCPCGSGKKYKKCHGK
jgi:hypothetical protein